MKYGSPQVHAELRLGLRTRCSRKRVERLMRQAGIVGIHGRRRKGRTRLDLTAVRSDGLVNGASGLLVSVGSIGDAFDNAVTESTFGILQLERLGEHHWTSRQQLVVAIFDWIERWYNARHRHAYVGMLSPIGYETTQRGTIITTNPVRPNGETLTPLPHPNGCE